MTLPRENPQDQRMMGDFDAFMRSVQGLLQRYENSRGRPHETEQLLAEIDRLIAQRSAQLLTPGAVDHLKVRFPFNRFPVLFTLLLRLRDLWKIDQSAQHYALLQAVRQLRVIAGAYDQAVGDLQAAIARMVPFGRGVDTEPAASATPPILRHWREAFWRAEIPAAAWTEQQETLRREFAQVAGGKPSVLILSGAMADQLASQAADLTVTRLQGELPTSLYRLPAQQFDVLLALPPLVVDLAQLPGLLLESARVLRPGGVLILTAALPLDQSERSFILAQAGFSVEYTLNPPSAVATEQLVGMTLLLCRRLADEHLAHPVIQAAP